MTRPEFGFCPDVNITLVEYDCEDSLDYGVAHACAGHVAYKEDAGITGEYSHALLNVGKPYGLLARVNSSDDRNWLPYVSPDDTSLFDK